MRNHLPTIIRQPVRRVASVANSEQVKIKPSTCSPVEVDDIVPSKSLSTFSTPLYIRRRRAPFPPRIPIYELPTTRRKLSQNYFCNFGWSGHQERQLNFCACGTSANWAQFYFEDCTHCMPYSSGGCSELATHVEYTAQGILQLSWEWEDRSR